MGPTVRHVQTTYVLIEDIKEKCLRIPYIHDCWAFSEMGNFYFSRANRK